MLIHYLSDLHLEFIKTSELDNFLKQIEPKYEDICVLAGDIGNPYSKNYDECMKYMNNSFKKTFVITGNHEYYNNGKIIEETNDFLQIYFKKYSNISFLNNSYEYYDTYCFVGTTLWSYITNPEYKINDTKAIKNFDYSKYNKLNKIAIDFLEDTVKHNTNLIIISHHVPSYSLIDAKYKVKQMLPYNQWFYCDMDSFIEANKHKLKCWIYGHTHSQSSTLIENIPFLCNPIGYPGERLFEENTVFTCQVILSDKQ